VSDGAPPVDGKSAPAAKKSVTDKKT